MTAKTTIGIVAVALLLGAGAAAYAQTPEFDRTFQDVKGPKAPQPNKKPRPPNEAARRSSVRRRASPCGRSCATGTMRRNFRAPTILVTRAPTPCGNASRGCSLNTGRAEPWSRRKCAAGGSAAERPFTETETSSRRYHSRSDPGGDVMYKSLAGIAAAAMLSRGRADGTGRMPRRSAMRPALPSISPASSTCSIAVTIADITRGYYGPRGYYGTAAGRITAATPPTPMRAVSLLPAATTVAAGCPASDRSGLEFGNASRSDDVSVEVLTNASGPP